MQIMLGELFIVMQVSWILGYFGKLDYFIQPHECFSYLSHPMQMMLGVLFIVMQVSWRAEETLNFKILLW